MAPLSPTDYDTDSRCWTPARRRRTRAGLFPAIDLEHFWSHLLADGGLGEAHRDVVGRARRCFRALGAHCLSCGVPPAASQNVGTIDQALEKASRSE